MNKDIPLANDLIAIVQEAADGLAFGTVNLTLKMNSNHITTVDLTKISRRKVDSNAQALSLIGTMLKLLSEAKDTGNLTFTITMNKGQAEQLMTHDFKRANLSQGSYK